jgi:UTP--glucose-1-phosphate uridylyltransferase
MPHRVDAFLAKMRAAGCTPAAIACFRSYYLRYRTGQARTEIREEDIEPPEDDSLLRLEDLPPASAEALHHTAAIKLNGGLGTSMGLSKAKSLLTIRPGITFLDVAARQAMALGLRLLLMDSYSTRRDTLDYLARYPGLTRDGVPLDFLQNQFPRIRTDTGAPLDFGDERDWNPPGHGDLYLAIQEGALLDRLIAIGVRFAFISNADNLGAVADGRIPQFMAANGVPFMMEVCRRLPMDCKGGHLAVQRETGELCLREAAQRPQGGDRFEDTAFHRWFNTNNLWLDLLALRAALVAQGGLLPLPLMANPKSVDRIPVVQLETAMGAAIALFHGARAVVVPRDRFAPVKKTCDLLVLRSDVYSLDESSGRLELAPGAALPLVDLDAAHYQSVAQLDERFPEGAPSLRYCQALTVRGQVTFAAGVSLRGTVSITAGSPCRLAAGVYEGSVRL